ncbi:MAG: hypothetical protein GX369_08555 [Euryarchaeota archaeon]|nr:hypothetical protein [Euryarchaeota archaeon]
MRLTANDTIKFGILTGVLAMFFDAAVSHGLFWQNDPFWSYWIADGLLITTIVSAGTAIIGIGIWQGFVLMGFQTLALEIYYQFLSPVGLPREPYWLSRFEIWTSGIPVHYLTYTAGFLLALWIWRRGHRLKKIMQNIEPKRIAFTTLIAAPFVLILDGIITQGIFLGYFTGITFLVHRFIIAFVFIYLWSSYVGFDGKGLISGALILSLLWSTFNMYLGAVGLPKDFPFFLSYDVLWAKVFPGALISTLLGLLIARMLMPEGVKQA